MKKVECPHLMECKQFIQEQEYNSRCLGKISWNQDNCFKTNGIGITEMRKKPKEWWGHQLVVRDEEMKKREVKKF
jgi:hypothetical protein